MKRRQLVMAASGVALFWRPAWAHHGWSSFDQDRPLYLEGRVVQSRWQNPHAELEIEVPAGLKVPADLRQRPLPPQSAPVDGPGLLAKAAVPRRTDSKWELELAPLTRMQSWKVPEIKVGDRVKIGEHIGEVTDIKLLTTFLRSPKNEQIVIPNSSILNSEVVNFSTLASQSGLILHTIVGIGYETPWRQVEAMLLEAAGRTPGLLREPAPFVLQKALGTFAVDYEINAYCDNTRGLLLLYTALHRNILDVFNEYGVQIMTPAYEGDTEQPKVVARENWYLSPAGGPSGGDGREPRGNGAQSAVDPTGSPRGQ